MIDFSLIWYVAIFAILAAALKSTIVITHNKTVKIIESFGKFSHYKTPGLSFKWPAPFQVVAKTLQTNIYPLENTLKLKTKDNLFITYPVTVQVKVQDPVKAAYELEDPNDQILSYISNLVRTEVGKRDFMELYAVRDEIQEQIQLDLSEKLSGFGFEIVNVLVDEPEPSEDVRASYDSVTQSKRNLEAAENNANAVRITRVAEAKAEKEAKKLYGEGIAEQRNAIAQGFGNSVETIAKELDITPLQALNYMTTLFKYDTIRDSSNNHATVIITDIGDGNNGDEMSKLMAAVKAVQKQEQEKALNQEKNK